MKKVAQLLFTSFFSLAASAQDKPLQISLKAGVTFPKIISSKDAAAYDGVTINESNINTSFYVGATADIALSKNIMFQPGFSVVGKGTKAAYSSFLPNSNTTGKLRLLYFEIPLNMVTYIPVGKDCVFFGLGPYLGVALSGTGKYTFVNDDTLRPEQENIKFGSDKDFNRFDFGGNALVGYQLANGLNLHGGISASALKISNSRDAYLKAKNLVYSVGFGFSL